MGYVDRQRMATAHRRQELIQGPFQRTLTPTEAFKNAFDETTEMEMFSSRQTITAMAQNGQKERLRELYKDGHIPEDVWRRSKKHDSRVNATDWHALAGWANENIDGAEFDFSWEHVAEGALERTQSRQAKQNTYGYFTPQAVMSFLGTGAAMFNPTKPLDFAVSAALLFVPEARPVAGSVARAMVRSGWHEAKLGLMEEGATQSFVYQLRNDVGDEYSLSEAAANLMAGMVIQGALGAGVTGINPGTRTAIAQAKDMAEKAAKNVSAEEFRSVLSAARAEAEKVVQARVNGLSKLDPSTLTEVNRRQTPFIPTEDELREQLLELAREDLTPLAGEKLSRGDVKSLERELADLRYKIENVPEAPSAKAEDAKLPKRRQKIVAQRRGEKLAEQQRAELQQRIDQLERRLAQNEEAAAAAADLSRIEQGQIPESYSDIWQDQLDTLNRMLEADDAPAPTRDFGTDTPLKRDPLTPRERAAIDDLDAMIELLGTIDFEKTPNMTAADAQAWLDNQWSAFDQLSSEMPRLPDDVRAALDADARRAARVGEGGDDVDIAVNTTVDEAMKSASLEETKIELGAGSVERVVRREDGEVTMESTTWTDIEGEEKARLQDVFARADQMRACVKG